MVRIYTFEPESGFGMKRVDVGSAKLEDDILRIADLTNAQLAMLFIIHAQGDATVSEIEFSLVMEANDVDRGISALEALNAVKYAPEHRGRKGALKLTEGGMQLLDRGLNIWRASKSAASDPSDGSKSGRPS